MCPNLIGSSFGHEHSTPPIGLAVGPVISTHTHKYNVAALGITKSKTHKYHVTVKVTRTHTHKYTLGHGVEVLKRHRYNVGGRIKRLHIHKWNLTSKLTLTRRHKYTICIKVTKSKTHKFNDNSRTYRTHTHKWGLAGRIYDDAVKTHKYNITTKIVRTHTHHYNILVPKIVEADLQYYKSTATNSLGGAITANAITHNLKHDLFDSITAAETISGDTEYRCMYVKNISTRSKLSNSKIWINSNTPSTYSAITIGLGTSAINGTEQTIGTEGTAPAGVTFDTAAGVANALSIGTLTSGQYKAVWLKRVINADSDAYPNDTFTIGFGGDAYASDM